MRSTTLQSLSGSPLMASEPELRQALLAALDEFDRWAGQDPNGHRIYATDKHGARWEKFITVLRKALRESPDETCDRCGSLESPPCPEDTE
jgi:hypothetical protein